MTQKTIPQELFYDLSMFISQNYSDSMPNSLLIAQAFILNFQDYGREFGLAAINKAVEEGIEKGLFNWSSQVIFMWGLSFGENYEKHGNSLN